jgi:hypothetical protein
VCRILLWMGLPLLEGMDEARRRGTQLCTLWEQTNADQTRRATAKADARENRRV